MCVQNNAFGCRKTFLFSVFCFCLLELSVPCILFVPFTTFVATDVVTSHRAVRVHPPAPGQGGRTRRAWTRCCVVRACWVVLCTILLTPTPAATSRIGGERKASRKGAAGAAAADTATAAATPTASRGLAESSLLSTTGGKGQAGSPSLTMYPRRPQAARIPFDDTPCLAIPPL